MSKAARYRRYAIEFVIALMVIGSAYALQKHNEADIRRDNKEDVRLLEKSEAKTLNNMIFFARQGCSRLNATRGSLYAALVVSESLIPPDAPLPPQVLAQLSYKLAVVAEDLGITVNPRTSPSEIFEILQRRLISAAAPFAVEPGSPEVDCKKAYPPPSVRRELAERPK